MGPYFEQGLAADLVVLEVNPLLDIRSTRRIAKVVRSGVRCDRSPSHLASLPP